MDALLGATPPDDDEGDGAEEEDFGFANIEEVRLPLRCHWWARSAVECSQTGAASVLVPPR